MKMKLNKKYKAIAIACVVLSDGLIGVSQAALPVGAILNFTDGVGSCTLTGTYPACDYELTTVLTGSYFAMDLTNPGFDEKERIRIERANATTGLTLNTAQVIGAIDLDWSFGGNAGRHHTLNPLAFTSTGANTYDVTMAGWTVNWGNEGNIDMGAGTATLTCAVDCTIGDTFTLEYTTIVPAGAFSGVPYALHLEGVIGTNNLAPVANNVSLNSMAAASHTWIPDVSDADGDILTCSIDVGAANGTASVLTDCSSGTYTPTSGASFSGADSFTYKVNDGSVDSNPSGIVSVDIAANPAPVCITLPSLPGSTTPSSTATNLTIDVTNGSVCVDANGNNTIVASSLVVTSPSENNASVSVDVATGVITYIPAFGFSGIDTFAYTVDDDFGNTSEPKVISITVLEPAPPEVAINIAGGGIQECSSEGGENVSMNADIVVSEGDSINYVEWTIDGNFISNQQSINELLGLGTHVIGLTVNTLYSQISKSTSVTIQDTTPPVVTAQFRDLITNSLISSVNLGQHIVRIEATAIDQCDPFPVTTSMYGTPTANFGRFMSYGFEGGFIIPKTNITLMVQGTDSAGNTAIINTLLTSP